MSSSEPKRRLRDILENISRVRSYIEGITPQQFGSDPKTQDAVERCLERISEDVLAESRFGGVAFAVRNPRLGRKEAEHCRLRGSGGHALGDDADELLE